MTSMTTSFDLRRLRYFVNVAELGSLTRAAAALHVAQPALSQQIKILENELGVTLLVRGPRGVTLTEEGERMLVEARRIFDGMKASIERVRGGPQPEGNVVIGVGQLSGSILMVPLFTLARERLPRVRLQVREMLGGLMPDLIRSGAVDFALALDPIASHEIESTAILSEDLCLVGQGRLVEGPLRRGRGDRFRFRDLAGLPLYMARRGQFIRDTVEKTAQAKGIQLTLCGEVDSHYILRDLAVTGVGCCILPPTSVQRDREQHGLYVGRITEPAIRRETYLVHRRETSRAAAAVIRLVMELVEGLVASGAWQATLHRRAAIS